MCNKQVILSAKLYTPSHHEHIVLEDTGVFNLRVCSIDSRVWDRFIVYFVVIMMIYKSCQRNLRIPSTGLTRASVFHWQAAFLFHTLVAHLYVKGSLDPLDLLCLTSEFK